MKKNFMNWACLSDATLFAAGALFSCSPDAEPEVIPEDEVSEESNEDESQSEGEESEEEYQIEGIYLSNAAFSAIYGSSSVNVDSNNGDVIYSDGVATLYLMSESTGDVQWNSNLFSVKAGGTIWVGGQLASTEAVDENGDESYLSFVLEKIVLINSSADISSASVSTLYGGSISAGSVSIEGEEYSAITWEGQYENGVGLTVASGVEFTDMILVYEAIEGYVQTVEVPTLTLENGGSFEISASGVSKKSVWVTIANNEAIPTIVNNYSDVSVAIASDENGNPYVDEPDDMTGWSVWSGADNVGYLYRFYFTIGANPGTEVRELEFPVYLDDEQVGTIYFSQAAPEDESAYADCSVMEISNDDLVSWASGLSSNNLSYDVEYAINELLSLTFSASSSEEDAIPSKPGSWRSSMTPPYLAINQSIAVKVSLPSSSIRKIEFLNKSTYSDEVNNFTAEEGLVTTGGNTDIISVDGVDYYFIRWAGEVNNSLVLTTTNSTKVYAMKVYYIPAE